MKWAFQHPSTPMARKQKISPPVRPSSDLPFHELSWVKFQNLCRDLTNDLLDAPTCTVFGRQGEKQFGADLKNDCDSGAGVEIGQCKNERTFSKIKLQNASSEFLDHWDSYWKSQRITKFRLFLGCELDSIGCIEQLVIEKAKFAEKGIQYEAWPASRLTHKLRQSKALVSQYFDDGWPQAICGEPNPISFSPSQLSVASGLDHMVSLLSGVAEQSLDEIKTAWRKGKKLEAAKRLDTLFANTEQWNVITPTAQAKILRFRSVIAIERAESIGVARRFAAQAKALALDSQDQRIEALIANSEGDVEMAIAILDTASDKDSLNLRASLQLQASLLNDCDRTLQELNRFGLVDEETKRVQALLYLAKGDLPSAQIAAQAAFDAQPSWESMKLVHAIVDYYSSLSPAALELSASLSIPNPVDLAFVKTDSEALERLRDAHSSFFEAVRNEDQDRIRKRALQTWCLACLANDVERQEEAGAYLAEILNDEPAHPFAVMWSLARGYAFNKARSEMSLMGVVGNGDPQVEDVLALVGCLLSLKHPGKAQRLLEKYKARFGTETENAIWRHWYSQALSIQGNSIGALAVLEDSPQQVYLNETRVNIIRNQCLTTRNWTPLVECLSALYGETNSSRFLYELCELHLHLKNWHAAAELASDLVRNVRTAEACRLAANALFRDGQFKECLEILESSEHQFPSGRLPNDLGRLRLNCLREMGLIVEAREEAKRLVQEEDSTISLLDLVNTHLRFGDYGGVATVGHTLLRRSDLTPEQALQLGWLVRLENHSLARALWDKANTLGIPDHAVVQAWLLGTHIGRQGQLGPLTARFEELAAKGAGGIHRVSLDELPQMMEKWRERAAELNTAYESATVPVHILAKEGDALLAQLFHLSLSKNRDITSGLSKAPLLFRHGGRPLAAPFSGEFLKRKLILDITSYLLAFHFDILGPVETAFNQVWISPSLIPALQAMRDRSVSRQPEVIDSWRQILKFVDSARIEVVSISGREDKTAWVEVGNTMDLVGNRVSVEALLEALVVSGDLVRRAGPMNSSAVDPNVLVSAPNFVDGTPLLFVETAIDSLAHASALEIASVKFRIGVDEREVTRLRTELSTIEQSEELGRWLGRCIEHLRLGLETQKYRLLPTRPAESIEHESSSEMACLLSLLSPNDLEDSIVWIDDRWANSHTFINKSTIVDAVQILRGLREASFISDVQYFEHLLRMRSAGILFIPLDGEEILFYLNQAKTLSGRIVETHGLRTLRQYAALCLEMGRVFQRPAPDLTLPNPKGEVDFLIDFHRATVETIARCWQDNNEYSGARAEWVLENLYVDLSGLSVLARWRETGSELFHLSTVSLVGLITRGFTLLPDDSTAKRNRREYFEWLGKALLEARFASNPLLVKAVSEFVKRTFVGFIPSKTSTPDEMATVKVLQGYYEDLPGEIKQELTRDISFIRKIGIRVFRAAHFGDQSFESSEFYRALRTALNGKSATLKVLSSERSVIVRPCSTLDRKAAVAITDPFSGDLHIGADPSMGLLSDSVQKRRDLLSIHHEWFDLPRAEFEATISDIATTKNLESRMEKLIERQSASAANFYQNLESVLNLKEAFHQPDVLPPATEDLLRHLRIETGSNSVEWAIEQSAVRLIEDEGVFVALERLALLPCPLPDTLVRHFLQGDAQLRKSFVEKLLSLRGSPIPRAHLVHLVGRLPDDFGGDNRSIERRLRKFIDARAEAEFRALKSILNWTYHEIVNRADADKYSAHHLLVITWYHANRLLLAMRAIRAQNPWIEELFPHLPQRLPKEVFDRNLERWLDVCHPARVTWELFGLSVFHYASAGRDRMSHAGSVQPALQDFAFLEQDGQLQPKPAFIVANELGNDRLASFLGGDPLSKLSDLVAPENIPVLTAFREVSGIAAILSRFEDSTAQLENWPLLAHVLGSLSLPEKTKPRLRELLMTTDFGLLVKDNRDVGLIALFEASAQAANLSDVQLAARLQSQLEEVTMILSRSEFSDRSERDGSILIEAAVNLSLNASTSESAISSFAALARRMVDLWPQLAKWLVPLASTFQRDLPVSQAAALWPLTIRIRGS